VPRSSPARRRFVGGSRRGLCRRARRA
jgi:hypothetical protein